jgi:IclR family acetate operon transcriptional repressor
MRRIPRASASRTSSTAKASATAKPASRASADQVQSVIRALELLRRIAEAPDGRASLTDLAQQVGLPASTAHRLLTTLEQERFVRFDQGGRLWSIGVQAFITGYAFTKTRTLPGMARPHMRLLMEKSGETVNLAEEDEGEAVYLAQVECQQLMRVFARPGSRVPLHCSAVGKAMLATMPAKEVAKILHRHGMPRLTVKTITDPRSLGRELERTREAGYAVDDEEHAVGLRCIAAPLFDETGDCIGAISVSGPAARIGEERIAALGALVRETAQAISAEMGAAGSGGG